MAESNEPKQLTEAERDFIEKLGPAQAPEGPKILRFPNRKERRTNLAKAGVKKVPQSGVKMEVLSQDEIETHDLSLAEVEKIHAGGSPHQHLDPNPHPNYDETVEELPRYLRRAFESRDEGRVEACIKLALKDGWEMPELVKAMHKYTAGQLH